MVLPTLEGFCPLPLPMSSVPLIVASLLDELALSSVLLPR